MLRRALIVLLGLLLVGVTASGTATAVPFPSPWTPSSADTTGMLLPHGRTTPVAHRPSAAATPNATAPVWQLGDCERLDADAPAAPRHCRPDNPPATSCTGYTSQTVAPATIRVLVRLTETTYTIKTVSFPTYVEDVVDNEWTASWDGDAVKAGAIAVKSYAWYWITHYGGFTGAVPSASTCFDVTDDADFQVYIAGSGSNDAKTVQRVTTTWPVAVRSGGNIVQTEYINHLGYAGEPCGYKAGGTITSRMSQDGTQSCNLSTNENNGYRYNVILKLYYGNGIDLSTTAQLRTPHDFTFTARSTGAAFSAGHWTIADGYPTTFGYGQKGDVPFAATTGDGFATAAVWRPSNKVFYVANALHQLVSTVRFGNAGDVPVAAHYLGLNTPTQLAVFRPSTGFWYFAGSGGTITKSYRYGVNGDIPVPGRWTSSAADQIAVWRPSNGTWYVPGQPLVSWGVRGDVPAPADYNGDGLTDVAVYRPSTHAFYVRNVPRVVWGVTGDVPVTGDFNGDGKADFAVYRPSNGNLYVHNQASVVNIGKAGTPIGAAPFRG